MEQQIEIPAHGPNLHMGAWGTQLKVKFNKSNDVTDQGCTYVNPHYQASDARKRMVWTSQNLQMMETWSCKALVGGRFCRRAGQGLRFLLCILRDPAHKRPRGQAGSVEHHKDDLSDRVFGMAWTPCLKKMVSLTCGWAFVASRS